MALYICQARRKHIRPLLVSRGEIILSAKDQGSHSIVFFFTQDIINCKRMGLLTRLGCLQGLK